MIGPVIMLSQPGIAVGVVVGVNVRVGVDVSVVVGVTVAVGVIVGTSVGVFVGSGVMVITSPGCVAVGVLVSVGVSEGRMVPGGRVGTLVVGAELVPELEGGDSSST
jgi:hypothetical protein